MRAAVVTRFDRAPIYSEWPDPTPDPGRSVVRVLAAGLHRRVRSQADGSHYTSGDATPPLVPGIDGVARTDDGALRYFVGFDGTLGSMAEHTVVDPRRSVELPADANPVTLAAAMNPAMSSWIALRRRVELPPAARVLILGATGASGQLATQVARHLGASHVTGVGRNRNRLALLHELGADATVALGTDSSGRELAAAGAQADVVLDYLWGEPTAEALRAIVPARADDSRQLTWIQIGSVAGTTCPVPSAALRATRLTLVGSGQGSVSTADIVAELGDLARLVADGSLTVTTRSVPLSEVESAWNLPTAPGERIVFVP